MKRARSKKPRASTKVTKGPIEIPNVTPVLFKMGAQSTYDPALVPRTLELAKLGLTQEQMAHAFGIVHGTFVKWLNTHQELRDAYEEGKYYHNHAIELTLLQRAVGFDYPEVRTRKMVDVHGRKSEYTETTIKKVLPDVTALIFWLKNRDPERWRDVHKSFIDANIDLNLNKTLKLETLTPEQLELVQGIAMKQIQGMNGIGDDGPGS